LRRFFILIIAHYNDYVKFCWLVITHRFIILIGQYYFFPYNYTRYILRSLRDRELSIASFCSRDRHSIIWSIALSREHKIDIDNFYVSDNYSRQVFSPLFAMSMDIFHFSDYWLANCSMAMSAVLVDSLQIPRLTSYRNKTRDWRRKLFPGVSRSVQ